MLQKLRNNEVQNVWVSDRHYLRHLAQRAALPKVVQLLLLQAHPPSSQLPVVVEDCPLEIIDKLHYYYPHILNF
jgi:hypothetical protein